MARTNVLADLMTDQMSSAHFEALGRFISAFSNAEAATHAIARKLLGVSDAKARIIFSGMRLGDLTERVRGTMRVDVSPATIAEDIDGCLVQLNHISEKRHRLVHRSSIVLGGKLLVTNSLTAKVAENFENDIFEIPELKNMTVDCNAIWLRLMWHCDGEKPDNATEELRAYLLSRPWQYKHVPPKPPNQQPRKAPE